MKVIPYKPAHAHRILERNIRERDHWLSMFPDWEKTAQLWHDGGPAETITVDGEPVMSAGIVLIGWGRGEAWSLLSTLFYRHVRACYRVVKKRLDEMAKANGLIRVQATAAPDYPPGVRLLEHLGFRPEGLLKAYGPNNEDLIMFARVSR
jgi:RimJ/RimL family protein N-acetyltransferase